MGLNRKTAVIGSAILAPIAGDGQSLEEVLYEVSQRALKDAGLSMDDIDGIVVGSNDQFDGRAISIMAASGSVGGVDRDILSTPSAGEHAFVMGVLRIASGQYETHLIVSWSPLEVSSLSEAQRLGADPYFHRRLPLDEASAYALQAAALGAAAPVAHQLAMPIVERSRESGAVAGHDPSALPEDESAGNARWPLRDGMIAKATSGAVALVIASEDYVREHAVDNPAWVRGMGWATEAAFLGDRDLSTAPALEEAARRAYEEAGIGDPGSAFDLVEITGVTPYQELIAYDALGLSRRDAWKEDVEKGRFTRTGQLPVNPSGGAVALNPVFCTGLMRIAEAARQIRGTAGKHQIENAKLALAHAASGMAMMYQTVLIFGNQQEGGRS
ncbi:MAG: thiolase family protein [Hyphomicrobiales bacterium]|nr:thiolase family protein [Hyphomicrobiales bacterium]